MTRITVLNPQDEVIAHMDNSGKNSLHYWDDELHEYLTGTAATLALKYDAKHPLAQLIREGCKLVFSIDERPYYMNIVRSVCSGSEGELTAWSTTLDLTLEEAEEFSSPSAQTLSWYISKWNWEGMVTIGVNEVSDKSIKCEWTGTSSLLERYYSIATKFDAEIELLPKLSPYGSLQGIIMNVYRAHDETHQGIGRRRSQILRYEKGLEGVRKTADITELYTAILPTGKDGLKLTSLAGREVLDSDGTVKFYVDDWGYIRAPQSMALYPSCNTSLTNHYNRYIVHRPKTDHATADALWAYALGELKKHCLPDISYEFTGTAAAGIGDTVIISDLTFSPPLNVETRITEQIRDLAGSVKQTAYSNSFSYPAETTKSASETVAAVSDTAKVSEALRILRGDVTE